MKLALPLAALLALSGSRGSAEAGAPQPLPTPYSAEQIRAAWQPGFRVETKTTDARGDSFERMTVLSASEDSGTIRVQPLKADGSADGEAQEFTSSWSELRDHARFDTSAATRERAECRSQLGVLPGWRYAATAANGDVLTMCFADATPGPPLEHETRREGKLLSRTEHTLYERPSGAKEKR